MARAGRWQLLLAGMALLAGTSCCSANTKAKTQANCACLPSWTDTNGTTHTGCANPDNDPLGPWCPVSPSSCLGYYSSFTNSSGAAVFYDYCNDVRERTLQGCLCAPEWNMGPGRRGKDRYADGCASPETQGVRICRVDLATCPESSTAGEFDACGPGPEQPPPAPPAAEALQLTGLSPGDAAAAAAAKAATFHGCACEQWSYEWSDGSRANFSGCANPDGDPQGAWCAVDPVTCDNFAGEMRTGNQTIAYDYCNVHYRSAPADICGVVLDRFSQCGGKSNCTAFGCVDAPWPGACCAAGLSCVRQQPFYHQCAAPGDLAAADAAAAAAAQQAQADGVVIGGSGGGSLVDFIPTAAGSLQSSSSSGGGSSSREDDGDAANILSGSSLAADILASSGSSLLDPAQQQQQQQPPYVMPTLAWAQGAAAGSQVGDNGGTLMPLTPALLPKQPGQKVYTKLRIDADYDALVGSPLKLSHFKADLVTWLKTVAANPEHIYGAGVDQVLRGSVVALAFVQLTSDAPAGEAAAALARLSSSDASAAYSSSGLGSDWGALMSFIVAPSRAELAGGGGAAGGKGVEEYDAAQTAAPGAAGGRVSGKAALTAGAVVGISLGGAALVGLAGFVLGRALASERARRHDADLDAKIAYYGELQEGDLHGLEDEEEEIEDDEDDDDGSQSGLMEEEEEEGRGEGRAAGVLQQGKGQAAGGRGWWWLRRPESLQHSAEAEMVQHAGPRSPAHVCRCPNGPAHDSDGGAAQPAAAAIAAAGGVASLKQRRVSVVSLSSAGGSSASGGGSSSSYSHFRSSTTGGGAAGGQQAAGLPHGHPHHLHHHGMNQVAAAAVLPLEKEQ